MFVPACTIRLYVARKSSFRCCKSVFFSISGAKITLFFEKVSKTNQKVSKKHKNVSKTNQIYEKKAVILPPQSKIVITMAKENEKEEQMQASVDAAQPTNKDKWLANMRAKHPEIEDEDALYEASMNGYDQEHDFAKRQREENERLAETLQSSPELARMYSEMLERGKDGHPEMALLNIGDLLQSYIKGEITSDEYVAEKEKRSAAEAEKAGKIDAQMSLLEQWCEKKGYDVDEWLQKAYDALLSPMSKYELAEAQFEAIDKMMNYDDDVAAAEIRGRNANIEEKKHHV